MRNVVSMVRIQRFDEENIKHAVYQAVELIEFKPNPVKSVLIKPNLCYYWDYSTGETTDPRVVSALIDYVRENNANAEIKVVESDASAMRVKYAFKMLGYEELAHKKQVELVNLSDDEAVEKEVQVGKSTFKLVLPRLILDAELFINVPKLKVGPYASGRGPQITCALKNLFGCIHERRKVKFHAHLDEVIVGVNKLIKPHLTVVDGIVALGKHPIRLGLVIAGLNPLAVDVIVAKVMGYNPQRIKHLRLAEEEEVWDVRNLRVVGENVSDFRGLFPKRSHFVFKTSWALQLNLLHLYIKFVKDVIPPVLEDV